ncbi:hypothetical protein FACS1894189_9160 [Planctomycetales bacterium]|nr:hypothetical protein FACS1894189_9160 [Planctomycetales bacterium]
MRTVSPVKRGRPRKTIPADALIPFRTEEIVLFEEFEQMNKPRTRRLDPLVKKPEELLIKKKGARRRMNPATSDRNYSSDEVEFMNALDEYKRASGHLFPTCTEILGVLRGLGYEKM